MYSEYISYIKNINAENINETRFKQNSNYVPILEHTSFLQGMKYSHLIENEFTDISFENIKAFIDINDKIGNPEKQSYIVKNQNIQCSPSSLRYIYHALTILNHYKNKNNTSIVEVGCGYGGLFLAIDFFSKILDITILNYYMVDLKEVGSLISIYLHCHKDIITTNYSIHDADLFGNTILESNLFFISNYCFSEIAESYQKNYTLNLMNKVTSGFVIWQAGFYSLDNIRKYIKQDVSIIEEKPQTGNNYFVYF